ncbi:RHS repeat-associated core domain-containing protein, partial [Tahibacter caeni]|uniref:RHS repeat-associated core domain-containing protein n=1 Tax=Tahibacter caeni TaxID=1453545 RepID=UPI0021484A8E
LAGEVTRYAYAHDGTRLSQTTDATGANPVTTHYLVDPNTAYAQVIEEAEQQGSGTPTLKALYAVGDDRIRRYTPAVAGSGGNPGIPAGLRYYHADGLGSTRLLTDETAAITDHLTYEAFGELDAAASLQTSDNAFMYTGEQWDPNAGFYYLRARYMDPKAGRFTQQDSFAGFDAEPISLHKYLYAGADAVNGRDPSGHMTLSEVNAVVGNLLSRSIAITNFVGRAQTAVGAVQSLIEALKILNDPSAISQLTAYLDPSNPDFQGKLGPSEFERASRVLRQNAARIARSVGLHRIKTFFRYVPDKSSTVVFYMPTPIRTPGNGKLISTGVPIPLANFGTRKAVIAVGGHSTRFFGLGFALGTRENTQRQLFRMDWMKMPRSNHFPGDKDNADYWLDGGFEFHVPREP